MRSNRSGSLSVAIAIVAASAVAPAVAAPALELDVELKLLWRGRIAGPVDLWAGGALRLAPTADGGLTLERPVEHPWVFRWYDARDEVKLGAEVWVERATGDAYGALAPDLERAAERRWSAWRRDPFWADASDDVRRRRDPLAEPPVYPFWVIGPPDGRFRVALRPDGSVDAGSIVERVAEPWVPDGWERSAAGEPVVGTGHWDARARERPAWAPNGYRALAAALALLDERTAPSSGVARVVAALLPRSAGRIDVGAVRALELERNGRSFRATFVGKEPGRLKIGIRVELREPLSR